MNYEAHAKLNHATDALSYVCHQLDVADVDMSAAMVAFQYDAKSTLDQTLSRKLGLERVRLMKARRAIGNILRRVQRVTKDNIG